ncbi:MAG TPA: bifunctional serine/threonine-protein kinase/formylglycine-generating enzyme family protein [Tepidisphaeraceae bacterium]|nr:bifunctional serine/threonine-protein kinase/formylglycine-generating enzyme family protein [Tepidisphaeraceae bacterium]
MGEQPNKPKPKRIPPSSVQATAAIHAPDLSQGPKPMSPHKALPIGSMLGKYKITAVLGYGGMGNVYAAEDPMIKRRVAIKVLPVELARDKALTDRLMLEAQAAGRLNHPNVVTIYDVNHADGHYFIVMELVPGGSVQDYLARKGSPGWRAATKLVGEACKALAAAHEIGLVHRDIKPSNLMLTNDGHVKVADFGLAKVEASDATMHTQPGTILGTPAFMSPEQCRGDKVDLRSDIYSLGCTYFAMLTGKPPFEAASSMQVMFAHCSAPIPDPRSSNVDAPDGCVEILQKALAKNPEDRYSTAKAMLADLRAVLGGGSVTNVNALQALADSVAQSPEVFDAPPMPEIRRPRQKLPGWVLLTGGVMAGMIIVLILGMMIRSSWANRQHAARGPEQGMRPRPPKIETAAAPAEAPSPPAAPVAPLTTAPIGEAVESNPATPAPAQPTVTPTTTHLAMATATQPPAAAPAPAPTPAAPELPAIKLEPRITNSIGQKLTLINAGSFIMGDSSLKDAPPHTVKLTKPFYIGECEVTQGDLIKIFGQSVADKVQHNELPAAFTSWEQATLFCRRLNDLPAERAAGRVYRLPTEAEWEYACRAGTATKFSFGNTITSQQANFGKDVSILIKRIEERRAGGGSERPAPPGPGGRRPPPRPNEQPQPGDPPDAQDRGQHPLEAVGFYSPNQWGLYDMHGNVWEWCSDFYDPSGYKHEEATDPTGPATGRTHVARGGCWSSFAQQCASAFRNGKAEPAQREPSYGFRVVCEIKPVH